MNLKNGHPFFDSIMPKMKSIALDAVKATYSFLDSNQKAHNFELFGMDFMIDTELQPWLIEINTNPCLETSCTILNNIIPELLEQTLKIGLDTIFPPPNEWPSGKKNWIPDNLLEKNKYELIFDEEVDGEEVQQVLGK